MYSRRLANILLLYLLPPIALLIITLYSYQETFTYPFYFDDRPTIVDNDLIHDITDLPAIWSRNPARFITFYSLALNYHFGKLDVFGYHIFNFVVHWINGLLIFWIVIIILETKPGIASLTNKKNGTLGAPLRIAFALIVAMLFVSHPIQTEAVTYVWQRTSSLVALFFFLSLALYIKHALVADRGQKDNRSKIYFAGSIFFAIIAMFTKQNAVTLPVAIILADYCFISGSLKKLKEKAPKLLLFLPVMMIIPILTAVGKNEEINHIGTRAKNVLSPLEYLLTQFNVLVDYLRLLVFPVNQNLDYDYPPAMSFGDSWFSFLLLVALLGLGLFLFHRNRFASFGIIFFFLTNSVESSFFPLEDIMFEHREYLPSAGVFMAVMALWFQTASRSGRTAIYGVIGISLIAVTALSITSFERNKVWKDELTLWKDVVSKSPGKIRGFKVLGAVYDARHEFEKAEKWFKKTLEIDPESSYAHLKLGLIYNQQGDGDLALEHLLAAIESEPDSVASHFALGNIYMRKKIYVKAADHYRTALKLEKSEDVGSFLAYGTALVMIGQMERAANVYKWILKLEPGNEIATNNLKALREQNKAGQ